MADPCNIKVSIGFDAEGYDKAVRDYLNGLVGEKYTQELYDEAITRIESMVGAFVKVADFALVPV
jgi:hypothetical protein